MNWLFNLEHVDFLLICLEGNRLSPGSLVGPSEALLFASLLVRLCPETEKAGVVRHERQSFSLIQGLCSQSGTLTCFASDRVLISMAITCMNDN